MATKSLYTAVGRFERRKNGEKRSYPVIILGGTEYMVDMQEMVIWTILNWRISRKAEIHILYQNACMDSEFITSRTWDACVERLLTRGLLVCGTGETEYDALYDLLSTLYIIPADGSMFLAAAFLLQTNPYPQVPFAAARKLFKKTAGLPGKNK